MNERFIEDLKNSVNLVDLVARYSPVKKSGKNYTCRSPFRAERTPSFSISPDKNVWYDFGASEGGDTITFVEKAENCSFHEAVEFLADLSGVPIPEDFSTESLTTKTQKNDLFQLHEKATEYFQDQFAKNKDVQNYCKNRGITEDMIKNARLGYGGKDEKGLSHYLLKEGFSQSQIESSGVSFVRNFGDKSMQDRFADRLIVPIFEPRNSKIIAFSARALQKTEKAKYINSPENPVYHKSSTLFGLHSARKIIQEKKRVLLVEGNFDVIFAHHAGIGETVATCGTALTEDHIRLLKRLIENLYLAFDTDTAGKKATLRATEMCLEAGLNPHIVDLSPAKDAGEFLEDPAKIPEFQQRVDHAPLAIDFLREKLYQKYKNQGASGQKKFLDEFFPYLIKIKRPLDIDDQLERLAKELRRAKSLLIEELKKFIQSANRYKKKKFIPETKIQFSREACFVGFLTAHWVFFQNTLKAQSGKILPLFVEKNPQNILEKKISGQNLTETEINDLTAWTMHSENMYEDDHPDLLKEEFQNFCQYLQQNGQKAKRLQEAEALRKKLGI